MRPEAPPEFIERLNGILAEAAEKGVTIPQIAKACRFDRTLISKWQKGQAIPTGTNLANLACYFGVTMDWLWGRPGHQKERAPAADGRPSPFVAQARLHAEAISERGQQRSRGTPRRRGLQAP